MLHRFRSQVGTAGLIVAIVALVVALAGGAYAATGGSGGGQATASAKGKPGPRGKTGKPGPAGPQGPAGSQGPAGAKGDKGDTGTKGDTGVPGAPGKDGTTGFTETLPSGKTETGAYRSTSVAGTTIEFNIPLPAEIDAAHQKTVSKEKIENEEVPTECENAAHAGAANAANPEAMPGYLCTFAASDAFPGGAVKPSSDTFVSPVAGASTAGAILILFQGGDFGNGTWAVTAP